MSTRGGSKTVSEKLGRVPALRLAQYDLSAAEVRALNALLQGATITDAANAADVHRSTVHRWRREDPDFQAAEEALRQGLEERIVDRLLSTADAAADVVAEAVTENGDVQTAFRLLKGLGLLDGKRRQHKTISPAVRRADQAIANRQLREFVNRLERIREDGDGFDGSLLELLAEGLAEALADEVEGTTDTELVEDLLDRLDENEPRNREAPSANSGSNGTTPGGAQSR